MIEIIRKFLCYIPTSDPLEVDINPVDKKRLVGENVTFCCEIKGDPAPKYYEW